MNAKTTRLSLVVDEEVAELLTELAGGERKRGAYISQVVRSLHAGELDTAGAGADLEQMRLAFTGLAAKQLMHDARLAALEGQVAALMSRG